MADEMPKQDPMHMPPNKMPMKPVVNKPMHQGEKH